MIESENGEPLFGLATKSLEPGGLAFLDSCGIELPLDDPNFDRMCIIPVENGPNVVRARPSDMPDRVAAGDTAVAIGCTDELFEAGYPTDAVRTVRKLGFGVCTMVVMAPESSGLTELRDLEGRSLATSYPRAAEKFFEQKGIEIGQIVRVNGSAEAMPYLPKTDVDFIVDLVQSGSSMRANRLRSLAEIEKTEAVLLENPALAEQYKDMFGVFLETAVDLTRLGEDQPMDLPANVIALEQKLAIPANLMDPESNSRKLLQGGVEQIYKKFGEEFAESLQAFFAEEDEALLDEAQTAVWLVALGTRARGLKFTQVVANAGYVPGVKLKGESQNDAVRVYGEAQTAFGNAILRGKQEKVVTAGANFLGAMDNLLKLRDLKMSQVYERL